jgi:hypothetical protein
MGYKIKVTNIWLYESKDLTLLAWSEESGMEGYLKLFRIHPHNCRHIDWTIEPSKFEPHFHIGKLRRDGFYAIYRDALVNYALRIKFFESPKGISLDVLELGDYIHLKPNWQIAYTNHSNLDFAWIFDLLEFRMLEKIPITESKIRGFAIPEIDSEIENLEN